MNAKQQVATGMLAIVIVASVVLMPVSAEVKEPKAMVRQSGMIVASQNAAELPEEQVRDLTYN